MDRLHVIHYQKDVENHAFISSLLATDPTICLHHLADLSSLAEPIGYPVHCILFECDYLTRKCLSDVQICINAKIPILFLVRKFDPNITPDKLHGVILTKPNQTIASSSFINQLLVNIRCIHSSPLATKDPLSWDTNSHELIAMGASAGGPRALGTILKKMPGWMCGIVVVQHMIDTNIPSFAAYLDQMCKLHVKVAEQNELIKDGFVYIAKQKQHLIVKKSANGLYLHYEDGAKVNCVCPSIDVLFQSLAKLQDPAISGVLLTGMGSDGANGLKTMKEAGSFTIIQNKETCELYGMPKEAKKIHAYHRELPLEQISDYLISHYIKLHQKKERTS